MSSRSREELENWLKTIPVTGRVVDVGGSQLPVKGRTKSWDITEYSIIDLEKPHKGDKPDIVVDINRPINFSKFPKIAGIRKSERGLEVKGITDIVFCLEVFEYLYRPDVALRNFNFMLKEKGILYLSTHYLYGLHNPKGLDFMRLTYYGIKELLHKNGFDIEEIIARELRSESKGLLRQMYLLEGMRVDFTDQHIFDSGFLIKAIKR
jgi:SAM-dependent methyltransferase